MSSDKRGTVISIDNASVLYRTVAGEDVTAVEEATLAVRQSEFVVVIGRSGCGKTTLLNLAAGLVRPTSGQVMMLGRHVTGPGRDRGLVFQADAVFPWKRVRSNVEFALRLGGVQRDERRTRAQEYLELVGLQRFESLYPKELSGGMRKRLAIAMVLANRPDVLLMDEPFGPLDYATKLELQMQLERIREQRPLPTLFVTHDVEEAVFLGDRVVVMEAGRIVKVRDVPLARPRNLQVRQSEEFASIASELLADILGSRA